MQWIVPATMDSGPGKKQINRFHKNTAALSRWLTSPPAALPGANLLQKLAKQIFTVPLKGLWPVKGTNLGSRGFISWPPEALFLLTLTIDGPFFRRGTSESVLLSPLFEGPVSGAGSPLKRHGSVRGRVRGRKARERRSAGVWRRG